MRLNRFVVYKDGNGEYRWKLVSKNGRILADSAEGYKTKYGVNNAITRLKNIAWTTTRVAKI
jgi:uncharacterized protein